MSNSKNLVIIPTFNEKENIIEIIESILSIKEENFHILVVDDNSPDGTANLVKEMITKHPDHVFLLERPGKQGLGTAYLSGFRWGLQKKYEYLFEMDADFSHNPNDLPLLLAACRDEGVDLAIGSRYVKGVNVINWPMSRVLMSYLASVYVRMVTGMPIQDTTAGFKCYRSRVLKTINLNRIQFVGYAFQIEMKFKTWLHGFKIKEVSIVFTDRAKGKSKMSTHIFKEAVLGVISLKIGSLLQKYPPYKEE
ncbi:MAG: polyprenol monophosphomannose synthase [Cyclobacteriaceae bacterium]|nr:polyprenol monophosphomannose synthase [Cyclobacteriaceae bacterium]MCH8516413.1 polyprenol monophosphomannose synthase [Cyclobacteriaceae bacterium]